jgi:hypothetical protein
MDTYTSTHSLCEYIRHIVNIGQLPGSFIHADFIEKKVRVSHIFELLENSSSVILCPDFIKLSTLSTVNNYLRTYMYSKRDN